MRGLLIIPAFALIPLLCGCSMIQKWFEPPVLPEIANPVGKLEEIAIVPVAASSEEASLLWTELLRGELLRVRGLDRVRVIDPGDEIRDPLELPQLPDSVQGLLEINVLRFDPYYPPVAHVEVNLYAPPGSSYTAGSKGGADAIMQLDRQGKDAERRTDGPRGPWVRFQKMFEADDPRIQRAIHEYAAVLDDNDRGISSVDRVTRISDEFAAFVVYETLKECFHRLDPQGEPDPESEANNEEL